MKHKVEVTVEIEKSGLFGKKVLEKKTIKLDDKTYKKMQKEQKIRPYSIEKKILYADIFDEWED